MTKLNWNRLISDTCVVLVFCVLPTFAFIAYTGAARAERAQLWQPVEIQADAMSLADCQHYIGHAQRGGARVTCIRSLQ